MLRKALAMSALAFILATPWAAAEEMTLDQVLDNYYDAVGGLEAIKGIKTLTASGNMSMGGGMEAPFTMIAKRPLRARLEFTLQGMTGIQAFDGTTGWMVMPFMGKNDPEEMPEAELKMIREQADFDGPLVDFEDKGYKVELMGKEDVEGTEAYKLQVTLAEDNVQNYFLDAEYYVPIKVSTKRMMMGTEVDMVQILGDYKEVGGVMMPHSIEAKAVGQPGAQVITLSEMKVNEEVADSLFAMPQPAAVE